MQLYPYKLGDKELSQQNFSDILKDTTDEGKGKFCFAFGSGSHKKSLHLGYITDALFLPEVTVALKELAKVNNISVDIESYLDIDVITDENIRQNYNIISIGSGRVNLVTRELLDYFGDSLKVRFSGSDTVDIISNAKGRYKLYSTFNRDGEDCGILQLICNPWAITAGNKRIAMIVAGNLPLGSVAAMYTLLNILLDHIWFSNKSDNSIPARVIEGTRKEYPPEFRENPHVTHYIGNLDRTRKKPVEFIE